MILHLERISNFIVSILSDDECMSIQWFVTKRYLIGHASMNTFRHIRATLHLAFFINENENFNAEEKRK